MSISSLGLREPEFDGLVLGVSSIPIVGTKEGFFDDVVGVGDTVSTSKASVTAGSVVTVFAVSDLFKGSTDVCEGCTDGFDSFVADAGRGLSREIINDSTPFFPESAEIAEGLVGAGFELFGNRLWDLDPVRAWDAVITFRTNASAEFMDFGLPELRKRPTTGRQT